MSTITWGKPKLEFAVLKDGEAQEPWTEIDTPKKDTTKLNTTEGQTVFAEEEGGDDIDSRSENPKSDFEFVLYGKKGVALPFEDTDGRVEGEFAFRLTPEDPSLPGWKINRAKVQVLHNYSAAEGDTYLHKVKILKPAKGKKIEKYTATPQK